ncbi:MAG TPA: CBS domain-containing protein [Candidatus Obscuribacterales bacterium]
MTDSDIAAQLLKVQFLTDPGLLFWRQLFYELEHFFYGFSFGCHAPYSTSLLFAPEGKPLRPFRELSQSPAVEKRALLNEVGINGEKIMTTCKEIMTPDPECCEPNTTADQVAQIMKNKNIGPLPVVENMDSKKLIGIVTDRDLVVNVLARNCDAGSTKVDEVMTHEVVSCKPDDDIKQAIDLMEQRQVRRMPVVDENNKLVGIIAQGDLALRLNNRNATAEVVREISKPEGAPKS